MFVFTFTEVVPELKKKAWMTEEVYFFSTLLEESRSEDGDITAYFA